MCRSVFAFLHMSKHKFKEDGGKQELAAMLPAQAQCCQMLMSSCSQPHNENINMLILSRYNVQDICFIIIND